MADEQEIVEALAKSVHDYFVRKGQTTPPWEEVAPLYRFAALEAAAEWMRPIWPLVSPKLPASAGTPDGDTSEGVES